jgi:phage gp29-like protein
MTLRSSPARLNRNMATTLPVARQKKAKLTPEPEEAVAESVAFTRRVSRESGLSQPQYLANTTDVTRINAALRAAERGDTWMYFTIVRDMVASFTHLQSEWNKRKMVIVGQPMSLIPDDPENAEDVMACKVVQEAIDNCRNWQDGLQHLLDATLYPLSVCEKIFEPIGMSEGSSFKYLKRMRLKELAPVNYTMLCFKVPYQPGQGFDVDAWESWLRFYKTEPAGNTNYGLQDVYAPDPNLHVIHRGNLLSPSIPPNFGGHIRAILAYWLLIVNDRDWWGLMMAKYGMPIPVGKADSSNKQTIADLQNALATGTRLGGIVIDKKAEIDWASVAGVDGSSAHKIFSDFCNAEVSKIVVGQTLSSKPSPTGMGSGASEQAEHVRDDIRMWDVLKLSDTLERQLFNQILAVNGYRGRCHVFWGGMAPGDAKMFAQTMQQFGAGGYELTDEGVIHAGKRLGYGIQRREIVEPMQGGDGNQRPTNKK